MPTLTVIIGSTRPGRAGLPIGRWFADVARLHGGFDVEMVDLAEIGLPLLDEPNHPRLGQYTKQHTKDWSAIIDRADAIVFVTPEYNHGYPAGVKNAIDYLHNEWRDKPVGFVSYGGVAAGTRAVQQLKPVVAVLGMVPVATSVNIPFHPRFIAAGAFTPDEPIAQSADLVLDELARLQAALAPLRNSTDRAA